MESPAQIPQCAVSIKGRSWLCAARCSSAVHPKGAIGEISGTDSTLRKMGSFVKWASEQNISLSRTALTDLQIFA